MGGVCRWCLTLLATREDGNQARDRALRPPGTWSHPLWTSAAMDEDLVLALQLQEEWNLQVSEREPAQEPLSLVDASWELVDPTPDLQALFVLFNDRFFWGQLEAVEVKWSVRMTLCAGICSYEGRGGMCSIRLSEPLLKLRPRKDLVETLLHEMIHAYLFVTNNDKDREGHGPEFCKHMHRINRLTGANITVYHTFHEEVDEYRRHWWRCNGPCQNSKPYYGYVKRATNRAPSAHDYWWAEHQKTCGGTYIKIKEPENYSKKGKGKTKLRKQPGSEAENKAEHPTSSTDGEHRLWGAHQQWPEESLMLGLQQHRSVWRHSLPLMLPNKNEVPTCWPDGHRSRKKTAKLKSTINLTGSKRKSLGKGTVRSTSLGCT